MPQPAVGEIGHPGTTVLVKKKKAHKVYKFKRKLDSCPSPQSGKLETAQQKGSSGVQSWELEKQVFWVVNPTQC